MVVDGGYLTLKFLRYQKFGCFLLSSAIRENDFFSSLRGRRSKIDSKIDTFGQFDTRDLAILGVQKIVFWTFSKFF